MILEFFEAILKASLLVGAFSFGLIYWGLHLGQIKRPDRVADFHKELKRMSKERKKDKHKFKNNPLYKKWFVFGGGFYGAVALMTYTLVEWYEFVDFLRGLSGFGDLISRLNLNLLINIFVEALTNFIVAVTWPVYWMSEIETDRIWLWCIAAYGGYYAGSALAHYLTDHETHAAEK